MVGILVLILGIPLAWLTTMTNFPGRKIIQFLLILPIALPAYISAYVYAEIFESGGLINRLQNLLDFDYTYFSIRNIFSASIILAFSLFPYVYLLTRISLIKLSSRYIEAGRIMGKSSWQCFLKIAIPMCFPGIIAGLSLCIMETMNDFGVSDFFGLQTLSIAVYQNISLVNNLDLALYLAFIILVTMTIIYLGEIKLRGNKKFENTTYEKTPLKRYKLNKLQGMIVLFFALIPLMIGFIIPILFLIYLTLKNLKYLDFFNYFLLLKNSFVLGLGVAIFCITVSIVINLVSRYDRSNLFFYLKKIINL